VLLLASASPRRRELVRLLGLPWRVAPQDVAEEDHVLRDPVLSALNVALAKARAARACRQPGEVILAADTLVVLEDRVLGKPADADAAHGMLEALRGRPHLVLTGISLAGDGDEWDAVVTTLVHMRDYAPAEAQAYVERGEPFDKAGGYAIQDPLFRPVARLHGCYLNVVGLPLCAVARGLETLGLPPTRSGGAPMVPPCAYCEAAGPSWYRPA
jgi:MAF protein